MQMLHYTVLLRRKAIYMKIGIMQPYFFPYIGYWQLINAVDIFVLYDDVNFIKKGWISRNNILLNKSEHLITIPLLNVSQNKHINECMVSDDYKAIDNIIKTINLAYKKAPYYNLVFSYIEEIIKTKGSISDLVLKSVLWIKEYLGLNTEIILSSSIDKNNELKGQDKIIEIVKKLNGNHYINAIGGQELYDKEIFNNNGIKLNFIKMEEIKYKQFNNEFVPNLSIIDVLMFNSPSEVKEMLNNYSLI